MGLPKVSVGLVNFRGIDDTLNAIKSIQESSYPKELTEIVVVDNASGDNSVEALKKLSNQIVLVESNERIDKMSDQEAYLHYVSQLKAVSPPELETKKFQSRGPNPPERGRRRG